MIEPEVAFADLTANMELAEAHVREMARFALDDCAEDIAFCSKFVDKDLIPRLTMVAEKPFQRLAYADAIEILLNSTHPFEYPVAYGLNLQSEHERFLTEKHFGGPVTVFNYPKEIKPFYMRQNDDGRTVAAMDLLVPGIGELIGGSQREERLDLLVAAMASHSVNPADYWWYTDLRKYGSVPHAGYGMGFERLLMFLTGVGNIRDVIPFARTPGSAEF
jgi:asparaginyl-tRNA synthetase